VRAAAVPGQGARRRDAGVRALGSVDPWAVAPHRSTAAPSSLRAVVGFSPDDVGWPRSRIGRAPQAYSERALIVAAGDIRAAGSAPRRVV
jgi:hypothetical protein